MSFNVRDVINRNDALWQTLWRWPKIELHRHLEGSVRLDTLIEVAQEYDSISLPTYDREQLRPFVQMTPGDAADFRVFLSKFDVLRQFYCSLDIVHRITREAVEDAAADNVRYMELRFTPHALVLQSNADYRSVIGTVCAAAAEAEAAAAATDQPIRVRLIVSVNRHESLEIAEQVLDAVLGLSNPLVVAMDLAGWELGHAAAPFKPIFEQARAEGLHITIHAGEWDGPAHVAEAIEVMGAERIGHGVRAVEDSRVVQLVREHGVTLEVCPTSNLHTGVVVNLAHHPLIDLSYLKAPTTINTDDPAISSITLTDELALAHVGLGLPLSTLKRNVITAARSAFLPDDQRDSLIAEFRTALGMDDTLTSRPW